MKMRHFGVFRVGLARAVANHEVVLPSCELCGLLIGDAELHTNWHQTGMFRASSADRI